MAKSNHNSSQNNDDHGKLNGKRRKIEPARKAPQTERGLTHSPYFNGPLSERMSKDLHLGGMSKRTHEGYFWAVRQLADFCKTPPDLITEDQLRRHFLHLKNSVLVKVPGTWFCRRTELAYVGWIKRFLVEHSATSAGLSDDTGAALPPESAIRIFLTSLAVDGNVAPSTQNQAKSALLFLYQKVFNQRIGFLDVVPAGKAERLPVVLSREEISQLVPLFTDLKQLMFLAMYGAGLRHRPLTPALSPWMGRGST